jgi:hypothetical protein
LVVPLEPIVMKPALLVATEVDFSLLRGTRPIAAGDWDDVQRAEAERVGVVVTLRLHLRGGKIFTAHDDAPGWDDLLGHAESALPAFPRARDWVDPLEQGGGMIGIYTRPND